MTNIVTVSGCERSGTSTAALLAVASLIARDRSAGGRPIVLVVSRTRHWADVHRRTLEAECLIRKMVSTVAEGAGDYSTYLMGVNESCHLRMDLVNFAIIDGISESEALAFLRRKDLPTIERAFIATSKRMPAMMPIVGALDIPPPSAVSHQQGMQHESA